MNLKYSKLKEKVIRTMADTVEEGVTPVGGSSYNADILQDAIHAAILAIGSRSWKKSQFSIPAAVTSANLPDDCIDVQTVFDKTLNIFVPKMQFTVGGGLSSTSGNAWHLYPNGTIVFVNEVGAEGCVAYYQASWELPTKDSDLIEPPASTLTCIVLYAASYALIGDALSSAQIRQFNTKVDAGAPGDIPAIKASDFLLRRFELELARLPMIEKSRNL